MKAESITRIHEMLKRDVERRRFYETKRMFRAW